MAFMKQESSQFFEGMGGAVKKSGIGRESLLEERRELNRMEIREREAAEREKVIHEHIPVDDVLHALTAGEREEQNLLERGGAPLKRAMREAIWGERVGMFLDASDERERAIFISNLEMDPETMDRAGMEREGFFAEFASRKLLRMRGLEVRHAAPLADAALSTDIVAADASRKNYFLIQVKSGAVATPALKAITPDFEIKYREARKNALSREEEKYINSVMRCYQTAAHVNKTATVPFRPLLITVPRLSRIASDKEGAVAPTAALRTFELLPDVWSTWQGKIDKDLAGVLQFPAGIPQKWHSAKKVYVPKGK